MKKLKLFMTALIAAITVAGMSSVSAAGSIKPTAEQNLKITRTITNAKNNIEELNNILEKSINIDDYPIIDNEYKNNLNKVENIINTLQTIIKPSIESKINFINGEIEIIEKNNIRA